MELARARLLAASAGTSIRDKGEGEPLEHVAASGRVAVVDAVSDEQGPRPDNVVVRRVTDVARGRQSVGKRLVQTLERVRVRFRRWKRGGPGEGETGRADKKTAAKTLDPRGANAVGMDETNSAVVEGGGDQSRKSDDVVVVPGVVGRGPETKAQVDHMGYSVVFN